jgi:hypothetical protein
MLTIKNRRLVPIAAAACVAALAFAPSAASADPGSLAHKASASADAARANVHPTGFENGFPANYWLNMCLDAEWDSANNPSNDGDKVQMWTCGSLNSMPSNQDWVSPGINTWGTITNVNSGKCLDAETDSANNPTHNGDRVELWTCNGGSQQQWEFVLKSNGYFSVCNKYAADRGLAMCLDAETDATHSPNLNGDVVQLWNWGGGSNQTWEKW